MALLADFRSCFSLAVRMEVPSGGSKSMEMIVLVAQTAIVADASPEVRQVVAECSSRL
jgi:hypothetical protein